MTNPTLWDGDIWRRGFTSQSSGITPTSVCLYPRLTSLIFAPIIQAGVQLFFQLLDGG
jgi:hypothetical protein